MFTGWGSWFGEIWNTIVDGLKVAGAAVIALLPDSPFDILSNTAVGQYMGWLNWLVPIEQIVGILEAWCSAILVYYIYVTILRWIKAIQ